MARTVRSKDGSSMAAMQRRLTRAEGLARRETEARREWQVRAEEAVTDAESWKAHWAAEHNLVRRKMDEVNELEARVDGAEALNEELRRQVAEAARSLRAVSTVASDAARAAVAQADATKVSYPTARRLGRGTLSPSEALGAGPGDGGPFERETVMGHSMETVKAGQPARMRLT